MLVWPVRTIRHPPIEDIALTAVLYALSDPVRLCVVRQLARDGEATCSALDGGRPKSSMSHHFRVLRDAGLVRTRTDGPAHMNELRRGDIEARFPGLLQAVLADGSDTDIAP
ncbi:ArsR/SmtB family transcription factor [Aureimonas psammosilenae]|uniref:ArsR/SmtB family transcription factor n=1 Tax=Aureimonas psammosilenae TaxID=2495496 RepID=UPI001F450F47|nr:helix-turn-helix domain-containing protein [Aureimonas psammosilenae]